MTKKHIIKRFDLELKELKEIVQTMGTQVNRAVANAVKSMLEQDSELAEKTIRRDEAINALEVQCDEQTRDMLVRRQPAAGDLRLIMGIVKVVTDLERMGDLASGIAKGTLRLREHSSPLFSNLDFMGEKVQRQIKRAMEAIANGDTELAMIVIEKDAGIDTLYKGMYREMLTYMMEDPRVISRSIILFNVAKNLERIADHATNIAEMVIYIERGHDIRHVDHEAAAKILAGEDI